MNTKEVMLNVIQSKLEIKENELNSFMKTQLNQNLKN